MAGEADEVCFDESYIYFLETSLRQRQY